MIMVLQLNRKCLTLKNMFLFIYTTMKFMKKLFKEQLQMPAVRHTFFLWSSIETLPVP